MDTQKQIAIIGSGSWATAILKILSEKNVQLHWYVRKHEVVEHIKKYRRNPNYISSAELPIEKIKFHATPDAAIENAEIVIAATPSAFLRPTLEHLTSKNFDNKIVVSAIKGMIPDTDENLIIAEYFNKYFGVDFNNFIVISGPCHAEEVASEQLSYLTFSGVDTIATTQIAACFNNEYINTIVNNDVFGVQYASIVKNIYALGAGIAHGLEYGDNFLSVYIANCASEMKLLLKAIMEKTGHKCDKVNYSASVYLGDLLVTCYSLHSRNRTFGNMIGKGYSVRAAELEMNMVAEGYNACKCILAINKNINAPLPIITAIYKILWEGADPGETFKEIEKILI